MVEVSCRYFAIFQGSLLKKAVHLHGERLFFVSMFGSSSSHKYWKLLKDGFWLKTDFRRMHQCIHLDFKQNFQSNFHGSGNSRFENRFSNARKQKPSLEAIQ